MTPTEREAREEADAAAQIAAKAEDEEPAP